MEEREAAKKKGTGEILQMLVGTIHSTVMATTDEQGLPVTCVIDLMLWDEQGVYFLTARGKAFHERLTRSGFVALTGLVGEDTMSSVSISLRGRVRSIGQERLDEIFAKNPYMARIYPTAASREALEVFQIYSGGGELFDLSRRPIFRQSFTFGGAASRRNGYKINAKLCIGCGRCQQVCPQNCIEGEGAQRRVIVQESCLHCGNCFRDCPVQAVIWVHEEQ